MTNEQTKKQSVDDQYTEATKQNDSSRSGVGAIKKAGNLVSSTLGLKSIGNNITIIKHRASFPLLRRVLSNEIKTSKNAPKIVSAEEVDEIDIDRSYFWHTIIIAITAPALIWSILILTKALAIGLRFDVWSPMQNQGLYTSVPMIAFTASKLYVSWHSRKAFKELNRKLGRDA